MAVAHLGHAEIRVTDLERSRWFFTEVMGLYVTEESGVSGARATGVVATARPDGRFDVELHLIARPVPLLPLGEEIRSRVVAAATKDGLTERLGLVDIGFEDLVEVAPADPPALGDV